MDYTLKHLLGKKGSFYKANLNASSSLGSGTLTPEELVKIYKENGYSILSINDEKPVSYNNLSSEDFLCLSGFSFSASEKNGKGVPNKKASFYAISLSEEPNAVSAFDAEYDKEKINEKLSEYKEKNYFITYASPARNIEVLPDHLSYEPYDAFEIINYSSLMDGQDEYSAVAYDNVSRHGKKVFAGGSDSNQNKRPLDDARSDSFGVFAMIEAESLDYASVSKAISEGRYYVSEGPIIEEIRIKGDMVHVKCSPADRITFSCGRRNSKSYYKNDGATFTSATFKLDPTDVYFRICVADEEGYRAYSSAYYTSDIFAEKEEK